MIHLTNPNDTRVTEDQIATLALNHIMETDMPKYTQAQLVQMCGHLHLISMVGAPEYQRFVMAGCSTEAVEIFIHRHSPVATQRTR